MGVVTLIISVAILGLLLGSIHPVDWTQPHANGLYIAATPNSIPTAGDWNVTARYYASASTWVAPSLVISVTMTFKGGSQLVETRLLSSGQGEVAVFSGTVGVVFYGEYQNSSDSVGLYTSEVIPSYWGGILLIASVTASLGLAYSVLLRAGSQPLGRYRTAVALAGVFACAFPVTYVAYCWTAWGSTGWLPSSLEFRSSCSRA